MSDTKETPHFTSPCPQLEAPYCGDTSIEVRVDADKSSSRPDVEAIRKRSRMTNWDKEADILACCDWIAHLERRSPEPTEPLEWTRRDRVDGDPVWSASLGRFRLVVVVECELIWGWEIGTNDEDDVARGSVYCDLGDDENAEWDYQGIDAAQRRAESVARGLLWASMRSHDEKRVAALDAADQVDDGFGDDEPLAALGKDETDG